LQEGFEDGLQERFEDGSLRWWIVESVDARARAWFKGELFELAITSLPILTGSLRTAVSIRT
jgi:hypothetical protein